jgi:hypothetical protein
MTAIIRNKTTETLACLIIDDPLLKPSYGCLNYEKLLREMKIHNFFTEIGFIPWNYKRSESKTVQLFVENPDYYALCVHGCNHTKNEFAGDDYQVLKALSSTALWQMEQHKLLTGLPYDPVIVFPQGRFSSVAMKAIKDRGFLAAVNWTARSTDSVELPDIESRDPVTRLYHDFPLFLRRNPKDKSLFIQDMELSRPIIIGLHHNAFRNGYKEVTDLVDWINGLGQIRWTSLMNIAENYLQKTAIAATLEFDLFSQQNRLNPTVYLRRFLSESRDNYIEKYGFSAKLYKSILG